MDLKKPFKGYVLAHWRIFTLGTIALFLTDLFENLLPLILGRAIDHIIDFDRGSLLQSIAIFSGAMIALSFFRFLWRIYLSKFHHIVAQDLRDRIFSRLSVFGPKFFSRNTVGELMSLMNADVNAFRMAIGPGLIIVMDAIFCLAIILPTMFYLSPSWTWKTMILLPLLPFFIRKMEDLIHDSFTVEQKDLADVSGRAQEIVSGIRTIKSYAQEDNQLQAFQKLSEKYRGSCDQVAQWDALFQPVMEFAVATGVVLLLYFCTEPVMRGAITLGTFFAFHDYIKKMVWPMTALGAGSSMVEQGRASMVRIIELLDTPTDIPDHGTLELEGFSNLKVQNLCFSYSPTGPEILKDLNFEIFAGESIGVLGPVGSGKSTLMHLLTRLHPVDGEQILVNGISIEKIRARSLRKTIALVPQDAFLLSNSVAENISLGLEQTAGQPRLAEYMLKVRLQDEVANLPQQFESLLGERGVNLSGGQKQRMTLARALIREAPVVILDDSLSAVDVRTEEAIIEQLRTTLKEVGGTRKTSIIISHRLSSLRFTDRIIVLKDGHIEAVGTHAELLTQSTVYRELHTLQNDGVYA